MPPFLDFMPEEALRQSVESIVERLEAQYGNAFYEAFEASAFPGPVHSEPDCNWMKRANTVGINVRTIRNFWNVIPYSLTLPSAFNAIHLLPVFEPGVASSLYGPVSWNINPEFFSAELAALFPQFDTVEKQLALVVRLLHLTGRAVGVDVIPHVDRFAEQVLANPSFFEWLRRSDAQIIDHRADLWLRVRNLLFDFLKKRGSAVPNVQIPEDAAIFFDEWTENQRLEAMFGPRTDYPGRLHKRKEMVALLYEAGLETMPATMGPPYRGLEVDPNPEAMVQDEEGRIWRDYKIIHPGKFSRAFGPLTRFRQFESRDNNARWELDFERPSIRVWQYVCNRYRELQSDFDFDFMRGDMSHVQMRPEGVPAHPGPFYDLLTGVKHAVLPEKPYFAYFAESFLAPPGEMAYGDECDHLEASDADIALGDLQSEPVDTENFMREFSRYDHLLRTRSFAPCFTVMTADKDDPRFDSFYLYGNEIRYFIALFLTDMPAYVGLGFECRDAHPVPAPNEHYTKLYVFHEGTGPKSTKGPYVWGKNRQLYGQLCRQKHLAEEICPTIADAVTRWLVRPDETGQSRVICWTQDQPSYVFACNFDRQNARPLDLSGFPEGDWQLIFVSSEKPIENLPERGVVELAASSCFVWKKKS